MLGSQPSMMGESEDFTDQVQGQVDNFIKTILPNSKQLVEILEDEFNLNVTNGNMLHINIFDLFNNSDSLLNATLPRVNLSNLFPDADFSNIESLDIPIIGDSSLSGMTLRDFIDGNV